MFIFSPYFARIFPYFTAHFSHSLLALSSRALFSRSLLALSSHTHNISTQRGPNKLPVYALLAMTTLSLICVMLGDLNFLAILSTIPFLITYAAVNWAYVSLAMTYDMHQERLAR